MPIYDPYQDIWDDPNIIDWVNYFKYLINLIFIVIPYAFIVFLCIGWNLWFNIAWNYVWAKGNVFLIVNTVYLIFQSIHSFLVAMEYPLWMRTFRITRLVSLTSAIIYSIIQISFMYEWYQELYLNNDKSNYDFMSVMWNMYLAYNVILHISILPVNCFIIIKELSLEFFQFLVSDDDENIAINFMDLYYTFDNFLWWINPLSYLDIASSLLTKYVINLFTSYY